MYFSTLICSALKRALAVAALTVTSLLIVAGTSAAAPAQDVAATSHGLTMAGVSVATLAWVAVGVVFLLGGLYAASKSGKSPSIPLDGASSPNSDATGRPGVNQGALAI